MLHANVLALALFSSSLQVRWPISPLHSSVGLSSSLLPSFSVSSPFTQFFSSAVLLMVADSFACLFLHSGEEDLLMNSASDFENS